MQINRIAFIGAGNLASALIEGILKGGAVKSSDIFVNGRDFQKTSDFAKKFGIKAVSDKKETVEGAEIVFLTVKPQILTSVLVEIAPYTAKNQIIVSAAAGISIKYIEDILGKDIPVIRIMPNLCFSEGAGAAVFCGGQNTTQQDLQKIEFLFSNTGIVKNIDEKFFEAAAALLGSGPAYIFYFCQAMEEAGIKLGLAPDISKTLAAQTVFGAGKMLSESVLSAEDLRKKVTSPNGMTLKAIENFQKRDLFGIVFESMLKAKERSVELGQTKK